jgi:deoxyribonuclease IV
MPLLGAHMSIAGGYYKAVEAARRVGCDVVQLFTKNNNQWRAKPIEPDDVSRFAAALNQHSIAQPLSHASYLINLASGNPDLWEKSVDGMVVELQRAEQLGIAYVVVHPGAHTGQTEQEGIDTVIRAIDEVHRRADGIGAQLLLEATAGQGTCLGCRFEHLAAMINGAQRPQQLGICVDTCHLFAAGYPLNERSDYLQTFRELDRIVGLQRIKAFHLNDSKKEFGSRVDRHEHIGRGKLGLAAFEHLLNDRRFRRVPMYLETPKETNDDGEEWDVVNLRTLRELIH